jgi:hypothetical protein
MYKIGGLTMDTRFRFSQPGEDGAGTVFDTRGQARSADDLENLSEATMGMMVWPLRMLVFAGGMPVHMWVKMVCQVDFPKFRISRLFVAVSG